VSQSFFFFFFFFENNNNLLPKKGLSRNLSALATSRIQRCHRDGKRPALDRKETNDARREAIDELSIRAGRLVERAVEQEQDALGRRRVTNAAVADDVGERQLIVNDADEATSATVGYAELDAAWPRRAVVDDDARHARKVVEMRLQLAGACCWPRGDKLAHRLVQYSWRDATTTHTHGRHVADVGDAVLTSGHVGAALVVRRKAQELHTTRQRCPIDHAPHSDATQFFALDVVFDDDDRTIVDGADDAMMAEIGHALLVEHIDVGRRALTFSQSRQSVGECGIAAGSHLLDERDDVRNRLEDGTRLCELAVGDARRRRQRRRIDRRQLSEITLQTKKS
jgi:hypothetical protein